MGNAFRGSVQHEIDSSPEFTDGGYGLSVDARRSQRGEPRDHDLSLGLAGQRVQPLLGDS